jgi:hypothetical protein
MTTPDAARAWLGRHDVADLDLGIADDHAGDEVFDQLALLLPGRLCQAVPRPRAERLGALGEARDLRPSVHPSLQLPHLPVQGPLPLLQVAAPPPVLREAEHAVEVGRGEPLERLAQGRRATAQDLTARLQLLRQPMATMRPLERPPDRPRLGQQPAEVVPDHRLERLRRRVAGLALRVPAGVHRRKLAAAAVVAVAAPEVTPCAGQAALPAADEAAQQVGVRGVVPSRERPVLR